MQARPPTFDARGDTPGPSDDDGRSRGQTTLDFAVGMSLFLISVAFVISFTPNLIQPFADSGTEDTIIANRVASQLVEGTLADPGKPYVLDKACTVAFFAPENLDGDPDNDEDLNTSNDDQLTRDRFDISRANLWKNNDCNFEVSQPDDSDYLHARLGIAGIADDGSVSRALSPGLQIEIRGDADGNETRNLLCLEANEDPDSNQYPNVTSTIVESPDGAFDTTGSVDCGASDGDYDVPFQAGEDPPEDSGSVVVARRIVTIDGIRATVYVRVW
ncbi:DUF7287 family protein [Haloglomus salinum]|uniref:DUF7287 family protein n=1 Tax=Haloglomus salinum TaxID=2962673 RepID=UPI0020CA003F|nr:hypothetical protein [Haloglomus salinum]